LNRPRERAFKQFTCTRPQCVKSVNSDEMRAVGYHRIVSFFKLVSRIENLKF